MSTIKLNELAESDINLSDLIAKSDDNGLMTRTNIEKLANYIGAIGSSGMKAAIESTSPAPTEDGLYPCTESGTYTNFGGEVVDISGQVVFISVSSTQTVFDKVVIPLNITFDSEPTDGSTNAVESGGVYKSTQILGLSNSSNTKLWLDKSKGESFTNDEKSVIESIKNIEILNPIGDYALKFISRNGSNYDARIIIEADGTTYIFDLPTQIDGSAFNTNGLNKVNLDCGGSTVYLEIDYSDITDNLEIFKTLHFSKSVYTTNLIDTKILNFSKKEVLSTTPFISGVENIVKETEFEILSPIVDFWVDDISAITDNGVVEQFKIRATYRDDLGFSDRFGIKAVNADVNIWEILDVDWDNLENIHHFKIDYSGTVLNILINVLKITNIVVDDTFVHTLTISETPQTIKGVNYKDSLLLQENENKKYPFVDVLSLSLDADISLKKMFVDFWVDDISEVTNNGVIEQFKIKGIYKNDATFSDRFGIQAINANTVTWEFLDVDWDNLEGLQYYRLSYLNTYLNVLINVNEVLQIPNSITTNHVFKTKDNPISKEYLIYQSAKNSKDLSTKGKSLALLADSIGMLFSTNVPQAPIADGDHDNQDWLELEEALDLSELINCGIGGSTWQSKGDANISSYPKKAEDSGYMENCLRMLDRLIADENRVTPDIIVMAMGTNNPNVTGNFNTIMGLTYTQLQADQTNRMTMIGSLRYNLETARTNYPDAEIYLIAPMQSADTSNRPYSKMLETGDAIKQMAARFSCVVFDALADIGICDLFEVNGSSGRYLGDGVHLNSDGKVRYKNWLANNILANYTI